MPTADAKTKPSTEQLLREAAQLSWEECNDFLRRLTAVRRPPKLPRLSKRESELLLKINAGPPPWRKAYEHDRIHAVDPVGGRAVRPFNARRDYWEEHFECSDDFLFVLGRTPVARATILVLRLNRPGVVNLRKLLRATGNHPPKRVA